MPLETRTRERQVKAGEVAVAEGSETLTALGVGSCLIITLWDVGRKLGGMAHPMIPDRRSESRGSRDARFVERAIEVLLERLAAQGADRAALEAKLVGGANMFPGTPGDIGRENLLAARKKLAQEEILVAGESVGGSVGRSVEFQSSHGLVTVKVKF